MTLKKLSSFLKFDSKSFFDGKEFLLSKIEEWREEDKTVGTKVTGVIFKDSTNYGDSGIALNKGESITFKVTKPATEFTEWKPFATLFRVTDVNKATVYGDFRNQLSMQVPSLEPINLKKGGSQ